MDPNATLAEARQAVADVRAHQDDETDDTVCSALDAIRVAEAFEALDEWLSKGGFLPEAWAGSRPEQIPPMDDQKHDGFSWPEVAALALVCLTVAFCVWVVWG